MKHLSAFILALSLISTNFAEHKDNWHFSISWGKEFNYIKTYSGDYLTIQALCYDKDNLYLYDLSNRTIALFNSAGNLMSKVSLASIGRRTYVGDDFVIYRGKAYFLNTVDKRIEIFSLKSGALVNSVSYPTDFLSFERKRRKRIITRIFIDADNLVLGNAYHLFEFDIQTKKCTPIDKDTRPPGDSTFDLYLPGITKSGQETNLRFKQSLFRAYQSPIPIQGKQYFVADAIPYGISISLKGIVIAPLEKVRK